MAEQTWRLVPVEPTLRQMAAMGPAIRASVGLDGKNGTVVDVYRAAIEAAPTPPAPQAMPPVTLPEPVGWAWHMWQAATAAERERAAAKVEFMTQRARWARADANSEPVKPCEYAAAIRSGA